MDGAALPIAHGPAGSTTIAWLRQKKPRSAATRHTVVHEITTTSLLLGRWLGPTLLAIVEHSSSPLRRSGISQEGRESRLLHSVSQSRSFLRRGEAESTERGRNPSA